jgi:hypothetical protein
MFNQSVSLPFATPEAPAALQAGFDELPARLIAPPLLTGVVS